MGGAKIRELRTRSPWAGCADAAASAGCSSALATPHQFRSIHRAEGVLWTFLKPSEQTFPRHRAIELVAATRAARERLVLL